MGISIGGLISGMDTDSVISKLLDIQKKPISLLQDKEADFKVKLSAYSKLQGSLESVKTAAKNLDSIKDIKSYSATSGDTGLLTVSAESSAAPGSYSVTVHSLATVHKLTSSGFLPSEEVGKGTLHLSLGSSDPVDIEVDSGSTISDIARAINDADAGIYASVINDGTHSFLTLTGKQTGEANVIKMTVTEDGTDPINLPVGSPSADADTTGLSRLVFDAGGTTNLTQLQGAANSDISVDGISHIIRATNTIDDVISGLTLSLKDADTELPLTVTVERSDELFTTRLNEFIAAYNGLVDSLSTLQSYDSQSQEAGELFGDSTTRRIQSDIQRLISSAVPGLPADLSYMTDVGISTNAEGKLELDTSVFNAKLRDNYDDVVKFFTNTDSGAEGFAVRMADSLEKILDTNGGVLAARTEGIEGSIDDLDDQIDVLNTRMAASETRLRAQFAALELLLGKYQSLSDSLTADLELIQNGWGTGSQ